MTFSIVIEVISNITNCLFLHFSVIKYLYSEELLIEISNFKFKFSYPSHYDWLYR